MGFPGRRRRSGRIRTYRAVAGETSQREVVRNRAIALPFTGAARVVSSPGGTSARVRREDISRDRCEIIGAWDCPKYSFRDHHSTAVRWRCRSFRSRRNNNNVGSPKCFGIGPHYHLLELPEENVVWNCRIVIDRLGLCRHIISGLAGHYSHRFELRRDIASGVVGHHHRLGSLKQSKWDHSAIIIWTVRRTSPSLGVALDCVAARRRQNLMTC